MLNRRGSRVEQRQLLIPALTLCMMKEIRGYGKAAGLDSSIPVVEIPEIRCPKCRFSMHIVNGPLGRFYSCNNFPRCKGTRNLTK